MTDTPCHIRPAKPITEEGLIFARLANVAASNGFRYLFGPRVEEIIAAAYVEPNNDFSHEFALLAEVEGKAVGMASGYTAKQHEACTEEAINRAVTRNALRVAIVGAMVSPMFRFMHTYDEGDFYLQFLAVEEDARGRGVGAALIDAMRARGRESGSTHYAVDVAARNAAAKRLYEREGFAVHDRWPRSRIMRPTILRMVQPL
jgi:ribosomal protein S18 acetylase RimI-like enzyme